MAQGDPAANPQWQRQMEEGMAEYEQKRRQQYNEAKRRNERRLEPGQKLTEQVINRQEADHRYIEQKNREFSPEVRGDQQAAVKRELNRQRQEDARSGSMNATLATKTGSTTSGQATEISEDTGQPARFGMAGIRNALAKQRRADQAAKDQINATKQGVAAGAIGMASADEAVKRMVKLIWMAFHEFLEDAALSLADLFIITGPLCLMAFTVRLIGMFSLGILMKITVRGVEVPLIPMFMPSEILPRFGKTALVALGTAVVWGSIALILWALSNKIEAIKVFGSSIVNLIIGG